MRRSHLRGQPALSVQAAPRAWLIANCRNGISSYKLGRAPGVTQKTAWFMLHRIRLAMQSKSFEKMGGTGEKTSVAQRSYLLSKFLE